jgi:hypothetical protein
MRNVETMDNEDRIVRMTVAGLRIASILKSVPAEYRIRIGGVLELRRHLGVSLNKDNSAYISHTAAGEESAFRVAITWQKLGRDHSASFAWEVGASGMVSGYGEEFWEESISDEGVVRVENWDIGEEPFDLGSVDSVESIINTVAVSPERIKYYG